MIINYLGMSFHLEQFSNATRLRLQQWLQLWLWIGAAPTGADNLNNIIQDLSQED